MQGELDLNSCGEMLSRVYPAEYSISPSSISAFQTCGYQYFLRRHLGLSAPEPEGELSPRDWGAMVHRIMETAYQLDSGISILTRLEHASSQVLASSGLGDFLIQVLKDRLLGVPGQAGLLEVVAEVINEDETTWRTLGLEVAFGRDVGGGFLLSSGDAQVGVHGIIDAVFVDSSGRNLIVLDYKTGASLPSVDGISKFLDVQLPLYFLAAQGLFPNYDVMGAKVFQIRDARHVKQKFVLVSESADPEIVGGKRGVFKADSGFFSGLSERVCDVVDQMRRGRFLHSGEEVRPEQLKRRSGVCLACEFRFMCRFEGRGL